MSIPPNIPIPGPLTGRGASTMFRKGPSPNQTAVAMVGIKPGKTAVVMGAGDGTLAAELALVTGLNGRTLVVDRDEAAEPVIERAAASAGALVDYAPGSATKMPVGDNDADVVVLLRQLHARHDHPAVAREAIRVIRPGGRVIVIEGERPPGLLARLRGASAEPHPSGDAICTLLGAEGLRAVRVLAETDGVTYVEGVKPRPEAT